MQWFLEFGVYGQNEVELANAARAAGHTVIECPLGFNYEDIEFERKTYGLDLEKPWVFHGSLGFAHNLNYVLPVDSMHSFCNSSALDCNRYYREAGPYLLNHDFRLALARYAKEEAEKFGVGKVFIRPSSCLKPFSGRVLEVEKISLEALDHGFYYDDPNIVVVIAPVREVGREFRFVIVDGVPVTGSTYNILRDGSRTGWKEQEIRSHAGMFAREVAENIPSPEAVYILDVCETPDGYRLLELNPFSGADLYACNKAVIVEAVARVVTGQ